MITINLELIGSAIVTILAIIALIVLILLLKKISTLVGKINGIIDQNESSINDVIKSTPSIVDNADRLVTNVNDIVADPNLKLAISKANDTMTNVSSISTDIKDTVGYFGRSAIDAADTLESGAGSISNYAYMAKDVVDIIRSVLKK